MKELKKERGITLIALIITIIVLIILAMVSIKLVMDGAIIKNTNEAVSKYSDEEMIEKVKLAAAETKMNAIVNGWEFGNNDYTNNLKKSIEKAFPNSTVEVKETKDQNDNRRVYSAIIDGVEIIIPPDGDVYFPFEYIVYQKYTGRWILSDTGEERIVMLLGGTQKTITLQEELQVVHIDGANQTIVNENETINLLNDNVTVSFLDNPDVENINMNNLAITLESDAFSGCTKLKTIENWNNANVEPYENGEKNISFSGCESLESVSLPNGITRIASYDFEQCINLGSVTIPNTVTSISNNAFADCNQLATINIDNTTDAISGAPWNTSATVIWLR